MTDGDSKNVLKFLNAENTNSYLFDTSINKCEKITISNCLEYSRFDQCKVCASGYYLDTNKKCTKNPKASI